MRIWSRACHLPPGSPKAARGRVITWRRYSEPIAALLLAAAFLPDAMAVEVPKGIWMVDGRVALEFFGCGTLACGRIRWLAVPRDRTTGALDKDKNNPNPALRPRQLCGLTILWNLQPDGRDGWVGGWFYNPRDGQTYHVKAHQQSADMITARIYVLVPLFGRTETLTRTERRLSPTCD